MSEVKEATQTESHSAISGVSYCTLATLNIGDEVEINHAHKFQYGAWGSWVGVRYKYLGFERGYFHFENVKYKHEHFRMKKEFKPSHVFKGKYSC
jgi:hypothetical protein